jgi:L-asparaginase II
MNKRKLIIEVTRGSFVESRHQVIAVICDAKGKRHSQWGNVDQQVFPRSTAKPLQALPLMLSGAAQELNLSQQQLAMACSSHNGEAQHSALVTTWLGQLGMSFEQLECGSHWPLYQPATVALAQSGEQACAVHNNCSGKHCGFLSFAHHQGINPKGYTHHQHPVQLAVNDAMGRMMDLKIDDHPMGIDGCSIPTYALPLPNLAMAFARFGTGEQLPDDWQHACHSLYQAMVNEPFYVAGSKRHCTKVMQAYGGQVACKTGAEGVFGAAIPSLGLGIALKALDGNSRAAEVALNALLDHLHIKPTETQFERHLALYNCNEIHVSDVQLASDTL